MSGPVFESDVDATESPLTRIEVREGRSVRLGGTDVVRVLPTKGRRTVGAWCFVDVMLPPDFDDPGPLEIGPHPHIGLSTVTWLFEGEALHGDSLGTEQVIRSGQLNLMTAGHGIAHSELGLSDGVHGVQLWIAQPDGTRHGGSRFQHLDELPLVDLSNAEATVLIGSLGDVESSARVDSPLIGADVRLRQGITEIPTEPAFEHAVVAIDRPIKVGEAIVEPGWLGLIPPGVDSLPIDVGHGGARAMLVGGLPLGETIQMWWNFVARSTEELTDAWRAWQSHDTDRFGSVPSKLARIDAPPPPWMRQST